MFSSLGSIWFAVTTQDKRQKHNQTDIIKICEEILNQSVPMALRLSAVHMGGVVIVDERRVELLHGDQSRLLVEVMESWKVKKAEDLSLLPKGRRYAKSVKRSADVASLDGVHMDIGETDGHMNVSDNHTTIGFQRTAYFAMWLDMVDEVGENFMEADQVQHHHEGIESKRERARLVDLPHVVLSCGLISKSRGGTNNQNSSSNRLPPSGEEFNCRLSGEIVQDILQRLPLKSALRCSQVDETWAEIVGSPSFNSRFSKGYLLVSFPNPFGRGCLLPLEDLSRKQFVNYPLAKGFMIDNVWTTVTHNGIICVVTHPKEDWGVKFVNLWNPVRKEAYPIGHFYCGAGEYATGIGNSSVVFYIWMRQECHVYSMITRTWGDIHVPDFLADRQFRNPSIFDGAKLKWLGDSCSTKKIISLDMSQLTFSEENLPSIHCGCSLSFYTHRENLAQLGPTDFYFCRAHHWWNSGEFVEIDCCRLMEDGSWGISTFMIPENDSPDNGLGMVGNGLIFFTECSRKLYSYDSELAIPLKEGYPTCTYYVQTLVSVKPLAEVETAMNELVADYQRRYVLSERNMN